MPVTPVRIRGPFYVACKAMADAQLREITDIVNDAVREYLERHEQWPPKQESQQ